jgi:hypothetical protein
MKDKIILNKIMNTQTEISFAWHVHHNILLEPLTEPITNRIAYIKKEKPIEEQPLRLRLLKEIKGKLPLTVVKAWEAHVKATEAYVKATEAYVKALEECKKEIKELHKKECPNCPWDGKTIFSKGWEKLK